MKSRSVGWMALSFLLIPWLMSSAHAASITLGTAGSFGVLAGSTVTNTGSSVIAGNVGVWPGTAITGFPPGITGGTLYAGGAVAQQAQGDLTTAYNAAASMTPTKVLTGEDLGGMTLTPGVYSFSSSAQLTGTLTLNDLGNPNAVFVFQIGSTLTTASSSAVVFTNSLTDKNVFWQVGSSATLGTTTAFNGNILALTSITLNTGASIGCGSALARNGAVTLDNNVIGGGCGGTSTVPEPGTMSLMGGGLMVLAGAAFRKIRS
jgi:Ice-binding-like/PEP-CTERM motif